MEEMTNGWRLLPMISTQEGERNSWLAFSRDRRMRTTSVIIQSCNRTDQYNIDLVPSSVLAIGIYAFIFGICTSIFNVVNFSHVETGTHAFVSACAALLFALLLTRLTLTCLARLNGLRSLVGLMMRLATNSA
ncbi:MAG TPA: hypothetical protein VE843_07535 [Ktedonobacteraceae bacterium]|nr:hypothetical protein [Ktedonobacteraceae bacterium]